MTFDELNALPTPESNAENKKPARNARGTVAQVKKRATATKAPVKGRPATRRSSGSSAVVMKAVAKKAPAKRGHKALAERNGTNGSDTEDVDDFEEEEPVAQVKPTKRSRPGKKAQEEEVVEEPVQVKKGRKAAVKEAVPKKEPKIKATAKSRTVKRAPEPEPAPEHFTIPETQPDADLMDVDISESIEVEEIPESMPLAPRPSGRRTQAQPNSRARRTSVGVRRTGSVSDSERDPVMRRRVGDLTRKLEAMTTKYETLKEAASSGRESNFEQLKKRTDGIAKDQDAVIKALKQQVTDLQSRTADLAALKKELALVSKESARLTTENKTLASQLSTAQTESKALSSKLAAARQLEPKTVPGSAVKSRNTGVVLPGTAELALAKKKEDLYRDLTNLVVVSVKKNEEDEDVYNCFQTGRNGSLNFLLTITSPAKSSTDSYDVEFIYQPLLEPVRDRDLLDLLPDYLTDDIFFPRGQAAKFYCKVLDSMGKKIVLEE
ncbi:hypothetical protein EJ02DRAFT_350996 [Clathrospora elynae]|uniref:Monopolin complex subunit Csm1/Pcs1 C-terminal domain-containing protein n=1 Tax=Clathrospora elynae TaxID=706981 RepID=A0A6A5SKK5_9PLEO|nr:hypothetical protein EJ02DRAFT_350996 [Clathrospora elynae]